MDGFQFRLDWDAWRDKPDTLANRVKFLRTRLGYSIRGAAKRGEMRHATWVDVESGKRLPRRRSLQLMAFVLGVRPSTLLTGSLQDWVDLMRSDFEIEPAAEIGR